MPSGSSPSQEAREVADRLHSAAVRLLRRVRVRGVEPGLTAPRLSALSIVVASGPLSIGELAAAERVRPPTMTRHVDALVRDGLVTKGPHPSDGRSVLVRATPTGSLMLTRGRASRLRDLEVRMASLSSEDLQVLQRASALMERIALEVDPGS